MQLGRKSNGTSPVSEPILMKEPLLAGSTYTTDEHRYFDYRGMIRGEKTSTRDFLSSNNNR